MPTDGDQNHTGLPNSIVKKNIPISLGFEIGLQLARKRTFGGRGRVANRTNYPNLHLKNNLYMQLM